MWTFRQHFYLAYIVWSCRMSTWPSDHTEEKVNFHCEGREVAATWLWRKIRSWQRCMLCGKHWPPLHAFLKINVKQAAAKLKRTHSKMFFPANEASLKIQRNFCTFLWSKFKYLPEMCILLIKVIRKKCAFMLHIFTDGWKISTMFSYFF